MKRQFLIDRGALGKATEGDRGSGTWRQPAVSLVPWVPGLVGVSVSLGATWGPRGLTMQPGLGWEAPQHPERGTLRMGGDGGSGGVVRRGRGPGQEDRGRVSPRVVCKERKRNAVILPEPPASVTSLASRLQPTPRLGFWVSEEGPCEEGHLCVSWCHKPSA